jgi:hypothetical protein
MKIFRRHMVFEEHIDMAPIRPSSNHSRTPSMKFQRIEFSWRAAFIGFYMTPERDKVWITVLPFFPLYFKRGGKGSGVGLALRS